MFKVIDKPIKPTEAEALAQEIEGFYIKVVADLNKRIICAGSRMHFDEEQELLRSGSKQQDLWGGGYDLDEKQITLDSIINNRPGENSSEEILDPEIREEFEGLENIY